MLICKFAKFTKINFAVSNFLFNFAKSKVAKCKCKMDIVSRIKAFMAANNISSTQFADACNIPRPSLSQILGGRNKKISDEVIAKIHEAYPRLSVMWLLFGEGEMLTPQNIQFSAPQNPPQAAPSAYQSQGVFAPDDNDQSSLFAPGISSSGEPMMFGDEEPAADPVELKNEVPPTVNIPADGTKSIVNIMVFYSDNSYQSFIPR